MEYSGSGVLFWVFILTSSLPIIPYKKICESINRKKLCGSVKTCHQVIRLPGYGNIYLLLLWLLIPNVPPLIISWLFDPIYTSKYSIGASLAFYLLVAKGMRCINHRIVKLALVSVVIVFSSMNMWWYYVEVNNGPWRDAINYISANAEPGDLVLFDVWYCKDALFDYYSKRTDLVAKPVFDSKQHIIFDAGGHNTVWVILLNFYPETDSIKKVLSETHEISYHRIYYAMKYYQNTQYVALEVYLFKNSSLN